MNLSTLKLHKRWISNTCVLLFVVLLLTPAALATTKANLEIASEERHYDEDNPVMSKFSPDFKLGGKGTLTTTYETDSFPEGGPYFGWGRVDEWNYIPSVYLKDVIRTPDHPIIGQPYKEVGIYDVTESLGDMLFHAWLKAPSVCQAFQICEKGTQMASNQKFTIEFQSDEETDEISSTGGIGSTEGTDSTTGASREIFNNWNVGGVDNYPSYAPSFTLSEPYMITYIDTYHWNYGSGTEAGGTIRLIDNYGNEYGPWRVETKSGQGGVPNAWWIAHPNKVIPAGEYTILDSDESTWSQNQESGGYGFSKVEGYPA